MPSQLTVDGIEVYSQPEIQALIEEDLIAAFGPLDIDASSINGQMIGVYTKVPTDISELIEDVYLSFSPSNAEGLSLDYILMINGLTRLPAISTQVLLGLKGTTNTLIPQGSIFESEAPANDQFETRADFTISPLGQLSLYVTIDTYIPSTVYDLTVGGILYSVNSGTGGTVNDVALFLKSLIDADLSAVVTAEVIPSGTLELVTISAAFDTIIDANMSFYTVAAIFSTVKDSIPSVQDTITTIFTPVSGLDFVNNFRTGTLGRPIESDADARLRRLNSLQILGAGTLPAMVARVGRDITGVITVKGFENRTDVVDGDGRPPHSFELVIQGGDEQEIFELIWLIKPGGIETFGNTSGIIVDDNGDNQGLNFTRPVEVFAHIRATITLHAEETFPANGVDLVKDAIKTFGDVFDIGQDLIRDRFCIPVFTVAGIETVTIAMDITALIGDTPTYTSPDIIQVSSSELAIFDLSNIDVIVV